MNIELLGQKVNELLDVVNKEKYPETVTVLENFIDCWYMDIYEFFTDIIERDKKYPLEKNIAKLVEEFLLEEIKEENDNAMCDLGALYYTGRLTGEKDYKKAVYYYEMSAKLGNRQAIENLGYCYYYGRLGEPDYKKAYHYFVKGALDSHIISLYKLGDMYKNGLYVEKDEREAYYIFNHCKEMLDEFQEKEFGADIYIRLADCYFNGAGTDRDLPLALKYYQQAEVLYYPRIVDGDFMYKKQYERAIKMQQIIRDELRKDIPSFTWAEK